MEVITVSMPLVTAMSAARVRLRAPAKGGVNIVSHATAVIDDLSNSDRASASLQLSTNEQHLQNPPTNVVLNESSIATWVWYNRFTTTGEGMIFFGQQQTIGVPVVGLVVVGRADLDADSLVHVYYEEIEVGPSVKLWLARQAPRRFPGNPQGP